MTPQHVDSIIRYYLTRAMWADARSRDYAQRALARMKRLGRGSADDPRVQRYAKTSDRMLKLYESNINKAIGWASR